MVTFHLILTRLSLPSCALPFSNAPRDYQLVFLRVFYFRLIPKHLNVFRLLRWLNSSLRHTIAGKKTETETDRERERARENSKTPFPPLDVR